MSQKYIQCFIPCNFRMIKSMTSLLVQLPDPSKEFVCLQFMYKIYLYYTNVIYVYIKSIQVTYI